MEWFELYKLAKGSRVTKEPEIPNFPNANSTDTTAELRGDISANHFWRNGTTAIFDIRVTDTDGPSYRDKDPAKVLKKQEDEKKGKYLDACREAQLHFTPMVFSIDGMEGKEAEAARKRLASKLAEQWN